MIIVSTLSRSFPIDTVKKVHGYHHWQNTWSKGKKKRDSADCLGSHEQLARDGGYDKENLAKYMKSKSVAELLGFETLAGRTGGDKTRRFIAK